MLFPLIVTKLQMSNVPGVTKLPAEYVPHYVGVLDI
jgi:hypothetical protein